MLDNGYVIGYNLGRWQETRPNYFFAIAQGVFTMAYQPTAQEQARITAIMAEMGNKEAHQKALNDHPIFGKILAHLVPVTMEGTNTTSQWLMNEDENEDTEDNFWHTENFPK